MTDRDTTARLANLFGPIGTTDASLTMIPAQRFIVDHRFQRHLTSGVIGSITRQFIPAALGVVYANRRRAAEPTLEEDLGLRETIILIDGQHRIEALLQLGHYDYPVPTLLFDGLRVEQEAALFRFFNSNRNRPTPLEIFKADLVANDPEAVAVAQIAAEYGIDINSGNVQAKSRPALLTAIGTARIIYRRGGPNALREVFRLLMEAWGDRPGALSARFLKASYTFIRRYSGQYDETHLLESLRGTPLIALERLGMTIGEEYSVSAATAIARAIRTNYNKNLPAQHQLPEWGTETVVLSQPGRSWMLP